MHPKMKETLDTIVAELEQGRRPWKPPYQGGAGGMPLRFTGEAYRGMNVVLLWVKAMLRGHGSPTWMTYRQAKELGGHVREGEGARSSSTPTPARSGRPASPGSRWRRTSAS